MNIIIQIENNISSDYSFELNHLADKIENECGVSVTRNKKSIEPGVKDSGLVVGLTIAGLSLALIQTIFTILAFWKDQKNKDADQKSYSVSAKNENIEVSLENIPPDVSSKLKLTKNSTIEISISKDL